MGKTVASAYQLAAIAQRGKPMTENPQARGFNYGQPIRIYPPQWQDWSAAADRERQSSVHSTNKSWALDAALRDIRIATTIEQYATAYEKARLLFAMLAPLPVDSFERVSTIPKPAVSATAENETDKAIHDRDVTNLVFAARAILSYGTVNRGDRERLRAALIAFANVAD